LKSDSNLLPESIEVDESLLALHFLFFLNTPLISALCRMTESSQEALASLSSAQPPLPVAVDSWLFARKQRRYLGAYLRRVEKWRHHQDHHILLPHFADYPENLRQLTDPPVMLFCSGNLAQLNLPAVAIVGSRQATISGHRISRMLAGDLTQHQVMIVSGLAAGIDASAHQGALDAGGHSVAILGTGCDQCYPKANQKLYDQLLHSGLVISELPLGIGPRKLHFPRRNRLIAAIALGVVVVEAALKSGSLITARLALEQGKEVFAVPGSIYSPLARGNHQLIRQGAKLVEQVGHILEELSGLPVSFDMNKQLVTERSGVDLPDDLIRSARSILKSIGYDPVALEDIILASGENAASVMSFLVEAELMGLIEKSRSGYSRVPGKS